MALLHLLTLAALTLEAAAFCSVTGSPPEATVEREVGRFRGIAVAGDLDVKVTTGSGGNITIHGSSNVLDRVITRVNLLGSLVLYLQPGTCDIDVEIQVPTESPLLHLSAASGANVTADVAAWPVSSSSDSSVTVGQLDTSWPISLSASSGAHIAVGGGRVNFATVTASSRSDVELGHLTARSAVLTASAESSISGIEADFATVTVTSASRISMTATSWAGYACSSGSELTIRGGARLTEWSSTDCRLSTDEAAVFTAAAPAASEMILP